MKEANFTGAKAGLQKHWAVGQLALFHDISQRELGLKMFDATLQSLPDTAKLVEACSKLLPLILKALGLPA